MRGMTEMIHLKSILLSKVTMLSKSLFSSATRSKIGLIKARSHISWYHGAVIRHFQMRGRITMNWIKLYHSSTNGISRILPWCSRLLQNTWMPLPRRRSNIPWDSMTLSHMPMNKVTFGLASSLVDLLRRRGLQNYLPSLGHLTGSLQRRSFSWALLTSRLPKFFKQKTRLRTLWAS